MINCPRCRVPVPDKEQFCPSCGHSITFTQDIPRYGLIPLGIGSILVNKYRITAIIKSHSSNIYQGLHLDSGKPTVMEERKANNLKTVKLNGNEINRPEEQYIKAPPQSSKSIRLISLKEEADLMALLDANSRLYNSEYFRAGDREYLVYESPVGKNLRHFAGEKPMDEISALEILTRLCTSVEKIHRLGYLYLGIEPANIYLSDNSANIYNFSGTCRQGIKCPYYFTTDGFSAPELMVADGAVIDTRADVYSLGALLYWMLTGDQLNVVDMPFSNVLSRVSSPDMARIIVECLNTNVELRLKTVNQLRDKIDLYLKAANGHLIFESAAKTDPGMLRANNEDAFMLLELSKYTETGNDSIGIYLVADGMGGHASGEKASAIAVNVIGPFLYNVLLSSPTTLSYTDAIRQSLDAANVEINNAIKINPQLLSMGTTATVGLRINSRLFIGNVGDSRCYLLRNDQLSRLTEDHTVVAGLLKRGIINEQQAKIHPDRGKILRCLGSRGPVVADTLEAVGRGTELLLQTGDILVFCTDGAIDELPDANLSELLRMEDSADALCQKIIQHANMSGGQDNSTVIIVKVKSPFKLGD